MGRKVALVDQIDKKTKQRQSRANESYTPIAKTEEGLAKENVVEDDIDAPVVFTSSDMVYMVLLLILPGCLAILPVCVPLANTFAKDGDNSIATNWAYYSVYNVVGWGAIWIKITLWNCELWDCRFFFPFMQDVDDVFFESNWSLALQI